MSKDETYEHLMNQVAISENKIKILSAKNTELDE
jgi:hypothetical protein